MKVLYYKNNSVVLEEVPVPVVSPGRVLVQTAFSVVSTGSELFAISESSLEAKAGKKENIAKLVATVREQGILTAAKKVWQALGSEAPLGYSSSGVVLEVGEGVPEIRPGDLVACMGMEQAVHGEIVSVPRRLVAKLPSGFADLKSAAFGAIGCIGMNAVRKLAPQLGETVVLYGSGLIGLSALSFLKLAGVHIITVDPSPERRAKAIALGALAAYAPEDPALERDLSARTATRGADGIIIAAGSQAPDFLLHPLQLVRAGGKLVILGKIPTNLDYNLAFKKDVTLLLSRSYGPGRYDPTYEERGLDYPAEYVRWTEERNLQEFLSLLAIGSVSFAELIGEEVPFLEAPEAYQKLQAGDTSTLGILLHYTPATTSATREAHTVYYPKVSNVSHAGRIRVGVIGVGDFSKGTALPILSSLPEYELRAVSARNSLSLPRFAKQYGLAYVTTESDKIINDPEVDLVFVLTPNKSHATFVKKCVLAGKTCFVEKPICTTLADQTELETLLSESPTPVAIGFNRRFAPLTLDLMADLNKLSGPTVLTYIINAGYMDPGHWMQNPQEGGGRLVSEVCHFIDFARFIVGSEIVKTGIRVISPDGQSVRAPDNYSIDLYFSNGSVANIVYTSLGAPSYPKEIIHVFRNGFAFEIRDFKTLITASPRGIEEKALKSIDKGHKREFKEFAKLLRGESSLIPSISNSLKSNRVVLEINQMYYPNLSTGNLISYKHSGNSLPKTS